MEKNTGVKTIKDIFFRAIRRDTPVKFFYLIYLELKRILFGVKHTAEFDVTENCNLKCVHCYHFKKKPLECFEEAPLSVWELRLKKLFDRGVRNLLLVGGEPAMRLDVLMLANGIFPIVYVITNGLVHIPRSFNHTLFVSIDGKEETNDAIRGDKSFSKVIENYKNDRRVIINMTLMKDNYKELEDVVKIAKQNNFIGVVCNIYTHYYNDTENDKLLVSPDTRMEIIKELRRVKRLYPAHLLFTASMIRWYEYPDHKSYCYWRENALHYDALFNSRRCFGEADCSDCGCFAGAISSLASRPLEQAFFSLLLRFRKAVLMLKSFSVSSEKVYR